MHEFSSTFKFNDYRKIKNKNTHQTKKTTSKETPNSKSKLPTYAASRNKGPHTNTSGPMEVENSEGVNHNQPKYDRNKSNDSNNSATLVLEHELDKQLTECSEYSKNQDIPKSKVNITCKSEC